MESNQSSLSTLATDAITQNALLVKAISWQARKIFPLLLTLGVNVNQQHGRHGLTVLHKIAVHYKKGMYYIDHNCQLDYWIEKLMALQCSRRLIKKYQYKHINSQ